MKPFWRKTLAVVGVYLVCEIGARVSIPGLSADALAQFFRRGGATGLMSLYDRFVGGALSRGALLALGVMPYLSATIWMRFGRLVSPDLESVWRNDAERFNRWKRALTVVLSVVQSYGFAQFVQSIPGAVPNPGIGFTALTMSILTAGSIFTMAVVEGITRQEDDVDADIDDGREMPALAGAPAVMPTGSSDASREPDRAMPQPHTLPLTGHRPR